MMSTDIIKQSLKNIGNKCRFSPMKIFLKISNGIIFVCSFGVK